MRFKEFKVLEINLEDLVNSEAAIKNLKHGLENGIAFKIPHEIPVNFIKDFQKTLLSSLSYKDPGYSERKYGCPNNYRVHWDHTKQATKGKFMSWSFYAWNEESSKLFQNFKNIYILRNRLAGLSPNKYLDLDDKDFAARIAAQFYPSGEGYMDEHVDPFNVHQFAIPTILLSDYGVDFHKGGVYVLDSNDKPFFIDRFLNFGDLFLFHTSIPHGVDVVDSDVNLDKSKNMGRLMMIAAVNALTNQKSFQSSTKNAKT
jgi:hypothetical protein